MEAKVVFFQLTHKFVNRDEAVPEGPRQVIYYSLAIGHHVGVMDCFQPLIEIPMEEYRGWVGGLPEGPSRLKLEGLLKWGEIEINRSHAAGLLDLFTLPAQRPAWQEILLASLQTMLREPALYLMVKDGMTKRLILTVGNAMMGDDAAGPLLARMLERSPAVDWQVLDGGPAPENLLYRVRELEPAEVLVVDAADMDLVPGEIRRIPAERLDDPFLMTTHTLPLSYLMESLREFVPSVSLLGIQPRVVSFGYPLSAEVKQAVEQVHESLKLGCLLWDELQAAGDG